MSNERFQIPKREIKRIVKISFWSVQSLTVQHIFDTHVNTEINRGKTAISYF